MTTVAYQDFVDGRVNQVARLLYTALNGTGYSRRLSSANPSEQRRYYGAARLLINALHEGLI